MGLRTRWTTAAAVMVMVGLVGVAPAHAGGNPPVAVPDTASTIVGTSVVVNPLANDTDAELEPLTLDATLILQSGAATVAVVGAGPEVAITPTSLSQVVVAYTVVDASGASALRHDHRRRPAPAQPGSPGRPRCRPDVLRRPAAGRPEDQRLGSRRRGSDRLIPCGDVRCRNRDHGRPGPGHRGGCGLRGPSGGHVRRLRSPRRAGAVDRERGRHHGAQPSPGGRP